MVGRCPLRLPSSAVSAHCSSPFAISATGVPTSVTTAITAAIAATIAATLAATIAAAAVTTAITATTLASTFSSSLSTPASECYASVVVVSRECLYIYRRIQPLLLAMTE